MILVTKLNGEEFVINSNLIETMNFIPETKISLTTGKYHLVKESKDEVIDRIVKYNQKIYKGIANQ